MKGWRVKKKITKPKLTFVLLFLLFLFSFSNLSWVLSNFNASFSEFLAASESVTNIHDSNLKKKGKKINFTSFVKHLNGFKVKSRGKEELQGSQGNINDVIHLRAHKERHKNKNVDSYGTTKRAGLTRFFTKEKNNTFGVKKVSKDKLKTTRYKQTTAQQQVALNHSKTSFPERLQHSHFQPHSSLACYAASKAHFDANKEALVPKITHVVWLQAPNTSFQFHQVVSLLSVQRFFQPRKVFFWHTALPVGTWWLFARQVLEELRFISII